MSLPNSKRRNARGLYRPIHRALFHDPRWLGLSAIAQLVLLALKILFGPAGIESQGPAALTETLTHATALTAEEVDVALEELEGGGWIVRDARTVWLRDQLALQEGFSAANWRHRVSIQTHLEAIPPGPVLAAWRARYPEWLVSPDLHSTPPDSLSHCLSDSLSHSLSGSGERRKEKGETDTTTAAARNVEHSEERTDATAAGHRSDADDFTAWLTPAREAFAARGRGTGVADKAMQTAARLHAEGVSAAEVERRARNLLAESGLTHAGLGHLFKTWDEWSGREAEAAERWRFYLREELTEPWGVAQRVAELVARGVWPTTEEAMAELRSVRPWDIARTTLGDKRKAIAKVAERLAG